jgi:hypothetical protein
MKIKRRKIVINYIIKKEFKEYPGLFTYIKIEETLPFPLPFHSIFFNSDKKCFLGYVEEIGDVKFCKVVSAVTDLNNIIEVSEEYIEENFAEINMNDFKQIEINIRSLKDLFEIYPLWNSEDFLFRGQADKSWRIESSLFRHGYKKGKESKLYSEITQLNQDGFNLDDFIELSCNMQHYGVPTRLVDWTSNLINACYFSCVSGENDQKKDGVIFAVENPEIIDFYSETYKEISAYLEYRYKHKLFKDGIVPIYTRVYESKKSYMFFKTKYSNDRIKRQNGYFSICFEFDENEALEFLKYKFEDYMNRNYQFLSVDQIEKLKEEIRIPFNEEQISKFNQSIENYNTFAKEKEKIDINKLNEALERFKTIKPIEHNMNQIQLQEPHIKIIISSKDKPVIINELDRIGVNSSTIYPDLEGMTKYMKEKYSN